MLMTVELSHVCFSITEVTRSHEQFKTDVCWEDKINKNESVTP